MIQYECYNNGLIRHTFAENSAKRQMLETAAWLTEVAAVKELPFLMKSDCQ